MLWVLPFPVSIVLPYSFLLPSTLYYCFSITYDKWYYFLWILKTHTKLMNQKVFFNYLSVYLGQQTAVDVNRTAQTHTDRQGTSLLVQTMMLPMSWCLRIPDCFCCEQCNTVWNLSVHWQYPASFVQCVPTPSKCASSWRCWSQSDSGGLSYWKFTSLNTVVVSDMHVNDCIDLAFTPMLDA